MPSYSVAILPFLLSLASALPNGFEVHDILQRRDTARSQQVHIPALEAAGMTAFLEAAVPFAEATEDEVTTNTIPITPVIGTSPTQRYLNMMLEDSPAQDPPTAGVDSISPTSPIKNVNNIVFMTTTNVGGQEFQLVLDTGSADTWLVSTPFKCLNNMQRETNVKVCKFAKEYKRSPQFTEIAGQKLRTAYADGEKLLGIMGKDTVTIAGVSVKNQTIGLVQEANWHGDGVSSGLLGMAFPSVTRAMSGEGPLGGTAKRYDPVFFNMHKQGLIKPMFAVTLNRVGEGPGALSLGGVPGGNIKYEPTAAKVPMEKMAMRGAAGGAAKADHTLYIAKASSFTVGGKTFNTPTNLVIDSGTTLSYLPKEVVNAIAQAWSPPLKADAITGQMITSCTSKPPKFGVTFGNKTLYIDAKDLVLPASAGNSICMIGVQSAKGAGGAGLNLLGGPFMKSVLTVFDVGAGEMRFHQRIR